jgi:hypothetical protein
MTALREKEAVNKLRMAMLKGVNHSALSKTARQHHTGARGRDRQRGEKRAARTSSARRKIGRTIKACHEREYTCSCRGIADSCVNLCGPQRNERQLQKNEERDGAL